jgi:hypothetical protein
VHKDEVARAEQRMRIDVLRQRAVEELGLEPDVLVEEYGPHQPVPPSPPARATRSRPSRCCRRRTTARSRRSGCARPSARWPCSAP